MKDERMNRKMEDTPLFKILKGAKPCKDKPVFHYPYTIPPVTIGNYIVIGITVTRYFKFSELPTNAVKSSGMGIRIRYNRKSIQKAA